MGLPGWDVTVTDDDRATAELFLSQVWSDAERFGMNPQALLTERLPGLLARQRKPVVA